MTTQNTTWLHEPRAAEGDYLGWCTFDVERSLPVTYSLTYSDQLGRWQARMIGMLRSGPARGRDITELRHYGFLEDALSGLPELAAAFAAKAKARS